MKAQKSAIYFLTKARDGQLNYLGPGGYLVGIETKLRLAECFDVEKTEKDAEEETATSKFSDNDNLGPPAAKKPRRG